MGKLDIKRQARLKRKKRIRKHIVGTVDRPRLCVFRSAKHIYAQVVDDSTGRTLAAAGSTEPEIRGQSELKGKISVASLVGKLAGERAMQQGIKKVVFDRNGFLYHGRIKAVSDGAREAGLLF
ncbi:MAG: 50S ribosomal protein L18 [Deltaproteobacteria bacterium]|nr:MAG: 50S ribosomal protein L18 [Deltaproteobacteria bacterium]